MSELEGTEAFTILLDRIVDMAEKSSDIGRRRDQMSSELAMAKNDLERERRARESLEAKAARDLPKLKALHEAAGKIIGRLPPEDNGTELKALKEALSAAADACGSDDIPF